jgi:hypothetical protein
MSANPWQTRENTLQQRHGGGESARLDGQSSSEFDRIFVQLHPQSAISPYGETKLFIERMVRRGRGSGLGDPALFQRGWG